MLSPYRVLDLTDQRANLAGLLLAQLGAEVVLVEPPGGSAARTQDRWHLAYNRGKRSVVAADPAAVAQLAASADVVLDCGALPGLDLAALRSAEPALVTVAVTPFGDDGPEASWPATDLTIAAAGGQLVLTGDADRPPVRISIPQSWLHGAAAQWHSVNAGKLSLALNLSTPEARDVVRDLVRWADVVIESFTPKAMRNWGLGYDERPGSTRR